MKSWHGRRVAGTVLTGTLVLLAGCSSSTPTGEGAEGDPTTGGTTAEPSGEDEPTTPSASQVTDLVVDVLTEPDSLDPMYRNAVEAQRYYRLVYSTLLRWQEDGSVQPELLTELPEISEDGLVYDLTLREGITFHDGSPRTADDVVFTFGEAKDPENGSVWLSALAYVDKVEAVDEYGVRLTLSEPYAYMESRLAMIPIIPDETDYVVNETYAASGNGTGPYRLDEIKRGDEIVLVKNEDYFGQAPQFESITLKLVPEDSSRIARVTNGESHIAPAIPANQVDLVRSRGAFAETVEANLTRVFFIPSMKEGRPTANADFRQAIAWAVDRRQIIDHVYHGAGRPTSTYLSYGQLYHDEALGLTFGERPDLEKAKALLESSGVDTSQTFTIISANTPDLVNAATIIQQNLTELGLKVEVSAEETAAYYPKLVSGDYDVILYGSPVASVGGFAPDNVNGGLNSTSANNFNGFADAEMDELLHRALTGRTDAELAEAWRAVQERDLVTQGQIELVVTQISEAWSADLGESYKPSNLPWLHSLLPAVD